MPAPPRNPYFKWTRNGCDWSTVAKEKSDAIKRLVIRGPKYQGTSFMPSSGSTLGAVAAWICRFIIPCTQII